eukprot:Plantae.Rhodophyta-Purpureofilum_apyrenoidigerum.ctg25108.p1 GENE.Plantae.Rhodophyta-Purpureofilum_apyrenoidigerum.ctg25108~~Plantae.Rhodophyta-Purpureofilum_apyrenoidigerum.ctg25108.p1  ORF type:complete len:235 (+),score=42.09 Plantae.Rhodophyta-Purpureofilum_apyrenoidigerum.ctg25108:221-925(+)
MAFVPGVFIGRPRTAKQSVCKHPWGVAKRCRLQTRMASSRVGVDDIVVIKMPYGGSSVARVTKVGGDFADVVELDKFSGGFYARSEKGKSTYESLKNMISIDARYDKQKNGYQISDDEISRATSLLQENKGSTGIRKSSEEKKDYSQPLVLPKPTKQQALIGTGIGLALAVAFYTGFLSARQTFADNPTAVGSVTDSTGAFFRQAVLSGFWIGSLLSLITGVGLLLYAFTAAEK